MLVLISDANVLIDMEKGGLLAAMFSLDNYQFAVPDILFHEELDEEHAYLLDMGLELKALDEIMVERVVELVVRYPKTSRNDLFALVLASYESCPLLTGDKALKVAAQEQKIEVHGTLWLIDRMVRTGKVSIQVAHSACLHMQAHGRRLPWKIAEKMFSDLETVF